uniref:F-box protein FBW2 n=1 Tax=Anthurium amnicola TaxID=1678845 RepID=A0A1D1Y459_9ARAE
MDESVELRSWDEMIPDALGLIFRKLSLQDILTVVPRVCKSWRRAVSGPYCWQEIEIVEWCRGCKPEQITRMLQMLIPRSSGSLRKLCVSSLPNDQAFQYIADHAVSLQTFELPKSAISDCIVEQVAAKLSNVTFLDVSYCVKMGACALEAFGKHCKFLVGLRRAMNPAEVIDIICQDDEAHAIASSMPKLKHLEMAYLLLTDGGVLEILAGCRYLEFLDIRGCWGVKLGQKFMKEKYSGLKVLGPVDWEVNYWDDYSDFSDSSGYLAWELMDDDDDIVGDYYDGFSDVDGEWDDEQALEELELRFYEDGFNDASVALDWPPSP